MFSKNIYEFYERMSFINGYTQVLRGDKFYQQFVMESLRNNLVKHLIFR